MLETLAVTTAADAIKKVKIIPDDTSHTVRHSAQLTPFNYRANTHAITHRVECFVQFPCVPSETVPQTHGTRFEFVKS